MITSELFSFDDNNKTKANKNHKINIGNKKFPLGKLQFKAHKKYNPPKSITISVNPSGHCLRNILTNKSPSKKG